MQDGYRVRRIQLRQYCCVHQEMRRKFGHMPHELRAFWYYLQYVTGSFTKKAVSKLQYLREVGPFRRTCHIMVAGVMHSHAVNWILHVWNKHKLNAMSTSRQVSIIKPQLIFNTPNNQCIMLKHVCQSLRYIHSTVVLFVPSILIVKHCSVPSRKWVWFVQHSPGLG